MQRSRALIIGGSLGGLFAANLLRSIGWTVVCSNASRGGLAGRGAGLGTHAALFSAMRQAGFQSTTRSRSNGARGYASMAMARGMRVQLREVHTSWDRLYRSLRQALPSECYQGGMICETVEQHADSVTAVFADGSRVEGDLLIGATAPIPRCGGNSFPSQAALRWLCGLARGDGHIGLPAECYSQLRDRMVLCFPAAVCSSQWPYTSRCDQPDLAPSNRLVSAGRSATAFGDMCTDATGRRHDRTIPPPLIRLEW